MLILASQSSVRKIMLKNAGVPFKVVPAHIDESMIKEALLAEGAPLRDIADALAEAKARKISGKVPETLVIGADQVLECEGSSLSKPSTRDNLRRNLLTLRGKKHKLYSAAVIYFQNVPIWRHVSEAQIIMREFSEDYLEAYVKAHFEEARLSVGGYQLEGAGAGLIADYRGDYFSVLGLPLFPILSFLRDRGEIPT